MRSSPLWKFLTLLCLAAGPIGCAGGTPSQEPDTSPDGGTVPDGGTGDTSTSDFAREMISAHNTIRISASPAPNPALPVLTWSSSVAATAQAWADQCKWGHNPNLGNLKLGENIYAATPQYTTTAGVAQDWGSEASFYDYGTNSCAPGKQCGHYTQIVWRNTTQLGCATARCTQNSPIGISPWQFWVCNYAPPGNYAGQRPY